ncbi:13798_t:CDS:2, partial [Funneliformis mosseae]
MTQYQGSITSFLNTPSSDIPSQEDFIQPSRKKIKHKRKKTILKEDETACNVKLKYDGST